MKKIFTLFAIVACTITQAQTVSFTTSPAAVTNNVAGQTAAGQQDDAFQASLDDQCIAASGVYTPIFGSFSVTSTTVATLSGLFLPNGSAYTGTVTVTARIMDANAKGTIVAHGATVTNTGNSNIQSSSPYPTPGVNGRFSENSASAANPNGVLFDFSVPITTPFSFWLGDVESRTDGLAGAAGLVKLFNNVGLQLSSTNIPTSSTDQTQCNGGGAASFSGCGNNETIFVTVTPLAGVPLSSILVQVGASDANVNANAIGIAGPSMGGSCSVVLGLDNVNFNAQYKNGSTNITWAAANEQKVISYTVEKSNNGNSFSNVNTVTAMGNNNYSYIDRGTNGTFYYRLKLLENNGSYYYTDIRKVVINGKNVNINNIYPSPAKNSVNIEISNSKATTANIQIINSNGVIVLQKRENFANSNFTKTLNVSSLASGVYIVKIIANGEVITQKFTKQ